MLPKDPRPPPKLETLVASKLARLEPEPLLYVDGHDLIQRDELTTLSGPGSGGKSLLMYHLACCCALPEDGRATPQWLGRPIKFSGRVVWVHAEETVNTIHRRLKGIAEAEGFDIADLGALKLINLADHRDSRIKPQLFSATRDGSLNPTDTLKLVEDEIAAFGADIVFWDNRICFAAVNLNDPNIGLAINSGFRSIGQRTCTSGVLLAHPSLGGMANGTGSSGAVTSIFGSRNFLYLTHPEAVDFIPRPDDGKRILKTTKRNDGKDAEVNMQWELGRYVCTDPPEPRAGSDIGVADKFERVFMSLMRLYADRSLDVSPSVNSKDFAPRLFAEEEGRERLTEKHFKKAMLALLDQRRIKIGLKHAGTTRERQVLLIA